MNSIQNKQNEEGLIKLLKAQRVAYSNAKKIQVIDLISILVALAATAVVIFELEYANQLAVFGVFWTLISIVSEIYMNEQTRKGAIIQEQFDTELFEIPWNEILVGETNDITSTIQLGRKFGGNVEKLKGWYSKEIHLNLKQRIAILMCYKVNSIWGMLQRNKFINFIWIISILYYGGMILLSIYKNTGLYDFSIILAPSLPFLVYVSSTIKTQKEIIINYRVITKAVDSLIEKYKTDKEEPRTYQLRQIQDLFYTQRRIPHKVPNWFYNLFRNRTNGLVDEALQSIIKKIE